MSKRVYISADYSPTDGDRNVIDVLHGWSDNKHLIVDYVDTAQRMTELTRFTSIDHM